LLHSGHGNGSEFAIDDDRQETDRRTPATVVSAGKHNSQGKNGNMIVEKTNALRTERKYYSKHWMQGFTFAASGSVQRASQVYGKPAGQLRPKRACFPGFSQ